MIFRYPVEKIQVYSNLTRTTGILREDQSSNWSASINPGLRTITALPSEGYLQRHPCEQGPTVTMGYI